MKQFRDGLEIVSHTHVIISTPPGGGRATVGGGVEGVGARESRRLCVSVGGLLATGCVVLVVPLQNLAWRPTNTKSILQPGHLVDSTVRVPNPEKEVSMSSKSNPCLSTVMI